MWAFHATSLDRLPEIRHHGLRPSVIRKTSRSEWNRKKLLFFGTSLTFVVPYANDYMDGIILRFPMPKKYEINPDQPATDAEAVTPSAVPASQIQVLLPPVGDFMEAYQDVGGYERVEPDESLERIGQSSVLSGYWAPIARV